MRNQEVHPTRLDMATFTDTDSSQNGHQNQGHCRQDNQGRVADPGLPDDPAWSQEDNHAKDVDQAWGKYTVPGAKKDPFGDQKMG